MAQNFDIGGGPEPADEEANGEEARAGGDFDDLLFDLGEGQDGRRDGPRRTRTLPSGAVVESIYKAGPPPLAPRLLSRKARQPAYLRMYFTRANLWLQRVSRSLPPEERGPALLDQIDDDALVELE